MAGTSEYGSLVLKAINEVIHNAGIVGVTVFWQGSWVDSYNTGSRWRFRGVLSINDSSKARPEDLIVAGAFEQVYLAGAIGIRLTYFCMRRVGSKVFTFWNPGPTAWEGDWLNKVVLSNDLEDASSNLNVYATRIVERLLEAKQKQERVTVLLSDGRGVPGVPTEAYKKDDSIHYRFRNPDDGPNVPGTQHTIDAVEVVAVVPAGITGVHITVLQP